MMNKENNNTLSHEAELVIEEVKKAVVGKDRIIENIMAAIVADGHILIEDTPGVGKTTMAVAFAKALGLFQKRVQFTPDVLPADLTGFSIYDKKTNSFVYQEGTVMCNLLLADEINRTSPKTQSALLEVMEERKVTVDGVTRSTGQPFIVIATQNPEGSAGTQLLPESQLDRFVIAINMGYPSVEEEVEILKRRQQGSVVETVRTILDANRLIQMQEEARKTYVSDAVYAYIANLAKATRENEYLVQGVSPRGTVALASIARACAWLQGRDYVIPRDVKGIFAEVVKHRVRLNTKAKVSKVNLDDVLQNILKDVEEPTLRNQQ